MSDEVSAKSNSRQSEMKTFFIFVESIGSWFGLLTFGKNSLLDKQNFLSIKDLAEKNYYPTVKER
jgi:hypothetical protein